MASMTADQLRTLIPADWRAVIDGILADSVLRDLAVRLGAEERDVLPAREQWFRALSETRLSAVRAVIIGQDPYPDRELADGLAFSVPDDRGHIPPSLARILVEAGRVATTAPGTMSLDQWAQRGVLLLNTTLTVPEGKAGGHRGIGWAPVTEAILRAVAQQRGPVAFMPWGIHAGKAVARARIVDGQPHIVSASVHPMQRQGAFVRSNPFGRVNERLCELGACPIDWSLN